MVLLKVRVFLHHVPQYETHSFLVDARKGGMSHVIGSINVDPRKTTLANCRNLVEVVEDRGVFKRNILFQEARAIMEICSNIFNRPEEHKFVYKLGLKESQDSKQENDEDKDDENEEQSENGDYIPSIFSEEDEEVPLFELVDELWKYELVLIPLSQIPTDDENSKD